jgi:hypothetical protein
MYRDTSSIAVCGYYLAKAVPLPAPFLLWANTPQCTLFYQNDQYCDLPEYWLFLLGHPVYMTHYESSGRYRQYNSNRKVNMVESWTSLNEDIQRVKTVCATGLNRKAGWGGGTWQTIKKIGNLHSHQRKQQVLSMKIGNTRWIRDYEVKDNISSNRICIHIHLVHLHPRYWNNLNLAAGMTE